MRKVLWIFSAALLLCTAFSGTPGFCATYIAEPVLISQPSYYGNSFYMYRPSNLPAGSVMSITPGGNVVATPPQPVPPAPQIQAPMPAPAAQAPILPMQGPGWMLNRNFMMVSTWKGLVDRMGMLYNPQIPVAWAGKKPKAIFAWTGKSWWQIHCKNGESPQCTLQRHIYALTKLTKENHEVWTPQDAGFLANQAALWGYFWMGHILPECP